MNDQLNKQVSRNIIKFSYQQFRKKEIDKMTRDAVINKIVDFIKSEVKDLEEDNNDN